MFLRKNVVEGERRKSGWLQLDKGRRLRNEKIQKIDSSFAHHIFVFYLVVCVREELFPRTFENRHKNGFETSSVTARVGIVGMPFFEIKSCKSID